MSTSRISELAQRIATNTAKIDNYLISHGLPQPSFELDASLISVIPENEIELKKARQEVLADTLELRSLIQGPRELMSSFSVSVLHLNGMLGDRFGPRMVQWVAYHQMRMNLFGPVPWILMKVSTRLETLMRLCQATIAHLLTTYTIQSNDLASQQAVTRFRLAQAFPIGSEITFGELAQKVGLGEKHIRTLVRHAITNKIFTEPKPGVIAHSACSRLIAEDDIFYSCKEEVPHYILCSSPGRPHGTAAHGCSERETCDAVLSS